MLSTWDLARPSFWHPMSMLEQPMMDLDTMADQILGSRFPMTTSMLVPPSMHEDDDFFRDLPVEQRGQRPAEKQPEQQREGNRAFSSYSSNSSSVVDGKGCRISSTRHRYEDSNGRLKAVHEREVDGKRLKTIWHCKDRDDQGEHKMLCSQGTPDEFEKVWSKTPFGQAQEKKNKELKEQGETGDQHQVQGTKGKSQIQEQQPMSKSAA